MVMTLYDRKAGWLDRFLVEVPLTYNWLVKKTIPKNTRSILDVGCGTGFPIEIINKDKKYNATGVDIYKPYLEICERKKIYKKLILKDIRKISFKPKSFDVAIAFHLIEHLKRKDACELIEKMEIIAKKRVAMIIPVGELLQDSYDENLHQKHISNWNPEFFRSRGYKVFGQGLKVIYGNKNVVEKYSMLSYLIFIISFLSQPLLFFKPEWSVYMFCYKDVK